MLCCGEDDVITDFLSMRLSVNVFDEPRAPKKLEVTFKLNKTLIEISKEVI